MPRPPTASVVLAALAAACAVLPAVACTDLSPVTAGVCGNGAIEGSEDCDGAAPAGQACGAPASANACAFTCAAGGAVCPDGFACGQDGRCRAPSDVFTAAPGPVSFRATNLRFADVDGDGFADLTAVQGSRLDVLHGSPTGELRAAPPQTIPTSTALTFGDLDGDGLSDIVIATPFGMVALLGGPAGYTPHPYSALALDTLTGTARVEQARASAVIGEPDLVLLYDARTIAGVTVHAQLAYPGSQYATCLDGTVVATGTDCAPSAGSAAKLLGGDIAIGRTGYVWSCGAPDVAGCAGAIAPGVDPTDEVAVAVQGATKLAVLSATEQAGSGSTLALAHAQDVALPGGARISTASQGRVMFADLDGDGCLDLVASTNGMTAFGVAYNSLVGGQCTGKLDGTATLVPTSKLTRPGSATIGAIRLFVDLDNDGVADVVTNQAIFLATCRGSCRTAYTAQGVAGLPRAWTGAVAVDINHDGLMDLAGFVLGDSNVDVLLSSGAGTFSRYTLFTDDGVRALVPGDFDGDIVPDLAIVTGVADDTEDDELSISYGTPAGGPGEPIAMGLFGAVDSLAAAAIQTAANDPEPIADLLVLDDRAGHRTCSILLGTTSRQVIAPFEIADGPALVSPAVVLLGNFSAAAGVDVVEIDTSAGAPSLYELDGTGGGDVVLGAADAPGDGDVRLGAQVGSGVTTSWTAGALTAGGPASVLAFTSLAPTSNLGSDGSDGSGGAGSGSGAASCAASEMVGALPPPTASGTWTVGAETPFPIPPVPGTACMRIRGAGMRDLDADGAADAIVQLCSTEHLCELSQQLVAWGGDGTLDLASPAVLPQPTGMTCGRFSPLAHGPGQPVELVAPCRAQTIAGKLGLTPAYSTPVLVILHLDPATRAWTQAAALAIAGTDLRVVLGDANGDGLTDIGVTAGVGQSATIQVYLQCSEHDASCTPLAEATP